MPSLKSAFVARLSGLLTFSDGSNEPFAVALDEKGIVSYNDQATSVDAVRQDGHSNAWLQAMFTALAAASLSADHLHEPTTAPTTQKTVTGMVASLSGRVALTNPAPGQKTWQDFLVQYSTEQIDTGTLGAWTPSGSDSTATGAAGKTAWDYVWENFESRVTTYLAGLGITWA
jgi:hypothetical protein